MNIKLVLMFKVSISDNVLYVRTDFEKEKNCLFLWQDLNSEFLV